jgi:hypothetical protein
LKKCLFFYETAQSKTASKNGSQNESPLENAFAGAADIFSHLYK